MIARGAVCWAEPAGGSTRFPVVVVQADAFNRSRIPTIVVVPLSANPRLGQAPGNVPVPARLSGLGRDTVANVAQVLTLDRRNLKETSGRLGPELVAQVAAGLRLSLDL